MKYATAYTQARHSESRGEKMGLEGRFKRCYGRKVLERLGSIVPE